MDASSNRLGVIWFNRISQAMPLLLVIENVEAESHLSHHDSDGFLIPRILLEIQHFPRNLNLNCSATFVCNQLDNTLRRDYQIKCKKWKNAWGAKPECCDGCQADFKTCYDGCKDQIDLSPPG